MRLKRYVSIALLLLLMFALAGCTEIFNRTFNLKYDISGTVQTVDGEYLNEVIIKSSGDTTSMTASEGIEDEEMQNWRMNELSGVVTVTPTKSGWTFIPESIDVQRATTNIHFTALPEEPGRLINEYVQAYEDQDAGRIAELFGKPQNGTLAMNYQDAFDSLAEVDVEIIGLDSFTNTSGGGSAVLGMIYHYTFVDGTEQHVGWVTEITFTENYGYWYIDTLTETDLVIVDEMDMALDSQYSSLTLPLFVTVPDRFVIETSYLDHNLDTELTIYDGDGTIIDSNDDSNGSNYSKIEVSLPNGLYYVEVAAYHDYELLNCRLQVTRVEQ